MPLDASQYSPGRKVQNPDGERSEVIGTISADGGVRLVVLGNKQGQDDENAEHLYGGLRIVLDSEVRDTYTPAQEFTAQEAAAEIDRIAQVLRAQGLDPAAVFQSGFPGPTTSPGVPVVPSGPTSDASTLPGGSAPNAAATPEPTVPTPAPADTPPAAPGSAQVAQVSTDQATGQQVVAVPGVGVVPLDDALAQGLVQLAPPTTPGS